MIRETYGIARPGPLLLALARDLYRARLNFTFHVAAPYWPFLLFGFDFTGKRRAAHTKRPIGRIDLVSAVILSAGHKSESTAGRLHNDLAFIADRIIHELVEHHLRRRPDR
jgi:hypothetical protein